MNPQDAPTRLDRTELGPAPTRLDAQELGLAPSGLGERATVVQVSSAFCAPCRAARTVAARVATTAAGVRHVEVDVAGHEDLAAALQIASTPTVLVLDAAGVVRERLEGVPRLAWLRGAVERAGTRPA
ncbi:thioredoxin family protein [Georgenia sp. EYE_87]|uniref:thioredoxin family protein n=1 Tax=Georgenia sp. EYE_87 TaxID=2853448 RepID=UPI002003EC6D|nr:thioredoxin family protein [Georgenia sp. EYE_87]MCK6209516.1 thioredoxin family protein [Georgenia sp. EYE_87]